MRGEIFLVNEEPYCLWNEDFKSINREFLEGIDTSYFTFLKNMYCNSDDERAALALRTAYHHGLETLFSLIGALVQAPTCPFAWVDKYRTNQLINLVSRINGQEQDIFTRLPLEAVTWTEIAKRVFVGLDSTTTRYTEIVGIYAELWERLANEFLNSHHRDEYNNIKHGLRIRQGGTMVEFGFPSENGRAPEDEEFQKLIESPHGTTTLKLEVIKKKNGEGREKGGRSFYVKRRTLTWSIDKTGSLLELIAQSIHNTVAKLKYLNGFDVNECEYNILEDYESYKKPWCYSSGEGQVMIKSTLSFDDSMIKTKQELLEQVKVFMSQNS